MSLINRIYQHVGLPFLDKETYSGLAGRMKHYQSFERLSLDESLGLQLERLKRICVHAYETVPFYRTRFDKVGFVPRQMKSVNDLSTVPFLTREEIRFELENLWSRKFDRSSLQVAGTGGTTSVPVQFLRDPQQVKEKAALQWSLNAWARYYPGDRIMYFWGARQDYPERPSWRWKLYDRYLMRRLWSQASHFDDAVLAGIKRNMERFRPDVIFGYATPVRLFAEYLSSVGGSSHSPKAAITTAEALTDQERTAIEKGYGCRAFEHYGARDFGMIAAECEAHEGMHIHPQAALVELVPFQNAEVDGMSDVIVTDLLNDAMPLIRYKVGDCAVGSTAPCSCGRGFPKFARLLGRATDNFIMRDGRIIHPNQIPPRLCEKVPVVTQIQVIQEDFEDFTIKFVAHRELDPSDYEALTRNICAFLGKVNIRFHRVEHIPIERSGKTRPCISKVAIPTAGTSV